MQSSAEPRPASPNTAVEPSDAEAFGRALAPHAARHRAITELYAILEEIDPAGASAQRLEQLERLLGWLRAKGKVPSLADASPADRRPTSRLRLLTAAIALYDRYRLRVHWLLCETLRETSGLHLLARLGLPGDHGLLGETADRLSRRFIPEPRATDTWTALAVRLFHARRDVVWLAAIPDELFSRFATLLSRSDTAFGSLAEQTRDAIALLGTRISAAGLSEVIRERSPASSLRESPFFQLPRACAELIGVHWASDEAGTAYLECRALCERCHEIVSAVLANLEQRGVSVEVVYRLELITKHVHRLEQLLLVLEAARRGDGAPRARDLFVRLLEARHRDRSLLDIMRSSTHLLARKIIERAGQTGEHYITTTRSEYIVMLLSAGGGGCLTAVTMVLKFWIGRAHWPLFSEGVLSALNYSGSFLLMQLLGFTLATKQPSMTAATLAGSLRETSGRPDLSRLVETITRITRSQLAAAIGNIGLVIPASFGLDLIHRTATGRPFLDADSANYVIASLHPTESGTLFYAALTGLLLWMSSIGAGWLENWATYRRLPEAIEQHRIARLVGKKVTGYAARAFARNVSGFGGNLSLGFLLGMTPIMGKFFGLPLDVRHVTLATSALTLAFCSLPREQLGASAFGHAVLGIVAIGLLNFGVSFVLALAVALRARSVDLADRMRLLWAVVTSFVRSPLSFVVPPKGESRVAAAAPFVR